MGLHFYTSGKSISRNGYAHDERKNGIANKFQLDLKIINPKGGNVGGKNSKSMQFLFTKNC
jgi:hypothetical protein